MEALQLALFHCFGESFFVGPRVDFIALFCLHVYFSDRVSPTIGVNGRVSERTEGVERRSFNLSQGHLP